MQQRGNEDHSPVTDRTPRRASRPPRRGRGAGLHHPSLGRASGRIRPALGRAPGLADRLHRLGRHGDRAAGPRGRVHRWALHPAGRATRPTRALGMPAHHGRAGERLAEGACPGPRHRLRPLAAYRCRRSSGSAAPGRASGAAGRQSARCRLDRPARRRRWRRRCRIRWPMPANPPPTSGPRRPPRCARRARRRRCSPIRIRRPGC